LSPPFGGVRALCVLANWMKPLGGVARGLPSRLVVPEIVHA